MTQKLKADVVIVGSGAGGAPCAAELAAHGVKVVVVEEGHRWLPRQFPASYGWALNHLYQDKGARVAQADTIYPMPAGRGVGGSTLVNSAICYRAPDHVLERWVNELGLSRLHPSVLNPIYDRVEETIGVVEMHPLQARANNLFIKRGSEALGLDGRFIHRNAPGCVGCGVCQMGCPSGGKGSVDRNFIPMAEESGAIIVSDSKVEEILMHAGRPRGVRGVVRDIETDQQLDTFEVEADTVILAAGSVGTPVLLLKQGLAAGNPHLGKHLSIHPGTGTFGLVKDAINSWDGVPQAYAVFLDRHEGILLQTYNMPPEIFFSSMPWSGVDGMRKMRRLKNLALCGAMVSDKANGTVTVGRGGKAKIDYKLAYEDRFKLIKALRAVVQILFAAGATEVYPGVGHDTGEWPKDEKSALAILHDHVPEDEMHIYASHPMGTCRMGTDPKDSVAGPDGQVHGIPGLYIADASLMPSSLGVNPSVTVMAMGILVAQSIIDSRKT
jgi:choline dehydrogenase-like flavoprotein